MLRLKKPFDAISFFFFVSFSSILFAYEGPSTSVQIIQGSEEKNLLDLKRLISEFQVDPSFSLTHSDIVVLASYARHSQDPAYQELRQEQKAVLARLILFHDDRFPKEAIVLFTDTQKIHLGSLPESELTAFNKAIAKIRKQEPLDDLDRSAIRVVLPKMAHFPTAYILDLEALSDEIGSKPFSKEWNLSEKEAVQTASLEASGLSFQEASLLKAIASSQGKQMGASDLRALKLFAISRLALDALDPSEVVELHSIVNEHPAMFPKGVLEEFNSNFNKNRKIQSYIASKNKKTSSKKKRRE